MHIGVNSFSHKQSKLFSDKQEKRYSVQEFFINNCLATNNNT